MEFNLIEKRWIPVLRRDGTPDWIAPYEVTKGFAENPVVSLNAPRPDFNGALIQFLIGLVQTVVAPQSALEWREKLVEPPTPEELLEKFATVRHAFELGGDGPRFMQDFEKLEGQSGTIDSLLIDEPGENALKNNTDFFVKRKDFRFAMCPSCSAIALFTLQTNAPAGGRGYMTSLRGGGPLTTLIKGMGKHDLLWHTIWLNILENTRFQNLANSQRNEEANKFPWMSKMKELISEQDMHPSHYYWAMPRRLRLDLEHSSGNCNVCSCHSDDLISHFKEKPNGSKYQEPMKHPLSAFNGNSTKAVLTQSGGVSYRHWLGLIFADNEGNSEPARVIHEYIQQRKKDDWPLQLWAFGYDFVPGQNKARCWYESQMPLLLVDAQLREEYEHYVVGMVRAAAEVASNTRSAVKKAWFKRPVDAKGDVSFVDNGFWHSTEPAFYEGLKALSPMLESSDEKETIGRQWLFELCKLSLKLFDDYAMEAPIEDADPKRVVVARKELEQYNHGKKIKGLLGIPVDQSGTDKKTKGKKEAKQAELTF
ncbi:type I-E CRISPR-associated protein Cse1/CasA [Geobacter sp. AOG1]|uniref:type I-E CRISPR-associated protein Cse1/CasA n=1 Tax=Geobacter sp. AOG1 TaxID=1566346 RepID=UPI001CC5EE71|nr:type I-E CRISPR-associated protein Cse1/CasA [Geobacter sp. AOG1]GFE57223.1 type I-E CRISPR-associated protein Cse1/CasA [Geobacter sp. AOG1]